jgi:hypothetical protein
VMYCTTTAVMKYGTILVIVEGVIRVVPIYHNQEDKKCISVNPNPYRFAFLWREFSSVCKLLRQLNEKSTVRECCVEYK